VLPVERRIRRRDDFTATVRDGRRCGMPGLVLHVRSQAGSKPARCGFIVSKAVGTAVVRNRIRRQLRHLIAPVLAAAPAGTDLVIRVMPAAAAFGRRELAATLDMAVDRANLTAVSA
jgi:ribonuclease P protein component